MKKSLLLHALSLTDRMLEPTRLPLYGRVWGYAKEQCGRESFIGHCLTMLSMLGMRASDISLKGKDIVAFDAEGEQAIYTVVISLEDDSLASEYFYFLGIWERPGEMKDISTLPSVPEEDDLLEPDLQYEVLFDVRPRANLAGGQVFEGSVMGELLHGGKLELSSDARIGRREVAHFKLSPAKSSELCLGRSEVRHALYSLRNLMALVSACMKVYDAVWASADEMGVADDAMRLMQKVRMAEVKASEWDGLVREVGGALLRASELTALRSQQAGDVQNLQAMFDSIQDELNSRPAPGLPSLWNQMRKPFQHAQSLLDQRLRTLKQSEKHCGILLDMLHSRMLAYQQTLLSVKVMPII